MTRRALALVASTVLAALAPGRAAADVIAVPGQGTISIARKSIVDLRFTHVVRQRFDLSCGAAAVATLLTYYYGDEVSEKQVITEVLGFGDKSKIEKEGFSMLELKQFGERHNYVVRGYRITTPDAVTEIKIPFLTLVNNRGYNHFVIVKGAKNGVVYIADSAFGNRSVPLDQFKTEWSNVILVFLSRTRRPKNQLALEPSLKAPLGEVVQILDRYLTRIRPGVSEF